MTRFRAPPPLPATLLGCALLALAGITTPAAVTPAHEEAYVLSETNRLDRELWLRADSVNLAGDIGEDISLFAKTIDLGGRFEGAVHAFARGQLSFTGQAAGQLRLGGNQIRIGGHAEKSLVAAAISISLDGSTRLDDTAALFGDTVITDGVQHGDLWVFANTATIQGVLHGTLHITADDIVIQPGTRIHGDVIYSSASELIPGSKVEIDGELIRSPRTGIGLPYSVYLLVQFILFFSAVLLAIPLLRLFPRTLGLSAGFVREAPGRCALTGIVALWALPLFAVACLLFPFTLPLGVIVLCGVLVFSFTGHIVVGLVVGSILLRKKTQPTFGRVVLTVTVGLLGLYILSSTPILNVVVWLIVLTVGLGGLILGNLASQQTIQIEKPGDASPPDGPAPPPVPPSDSMNQPPEPKE